DRSGNVTGRITGLEMRITEAALNATFHSADGLQRAKRRSLERDASAGLGQGGANFGNLAGDSGALERYAKRHAGHAGAYDQHVLDCGHGHQHDVRNGSRQEVLSGAKTAPKQRQIPSFALVLLGSKPIYSVEFTDQHWCYRFRPVCRMRSSSVT